VKQCIFFSQAWYYWMGNLVGEEE